MSIKSISTLIGLDKHIFSYQFGYNCFTGRYRQRAHPKYNLDLLLHRIKRKS